jgi:hypothetical protein
MSPALTLFVTITANQTEVQSLLMGPIVAGVATVSAHFTDGQAGNKCPLGPNVQHMGTDMN